MDAESIEAASALYAGLTAFSERQPASVIRGKELEPSGFAFTFEPAKAPSLEVAGGVGWFSLFYEFAGFEGDLPDRATAEWVIRLCESASAGRVRQHRIWRPILGRIITVFEVGAQGEAEQARNVQYALTPCRGAVPHDPPSPPGPSGQTQPDPMVAQRQFRVLARPGQDWAS